MRKYFILAATALAMVACSNEENENAVQNTDNVIRLTASVGAAQTRAAYNIQSTAFDANELINVECTPVGGSPASKVYTTSAASEGVNDLTIESNPFYWPANGANVSLKAYYPSTVTSETTSFSVQEDQSAATGYKASDLMYSAALNVDNTTANHVLRHGFTFTHALTKIIVKLTPGAGMTADDLAAATITLHAKKTATIIAGVVDAASGDVVNIGMGTGSNNTDGIAAIIVPQTIDGSETAQNFITVTSGGNPVTYKLALVKAFEAGKVYTYNLTVSMADIELKSTTINDWTSGGDAIPGSVEI